MASRRLTFRLYPASGSEAKAVFLPGNFTKYCITLTLHSVVLSGERTEKLLTTPHSKTHYQDLENSGMTTSHLT